MCEGGVVVVRCDGERDPNGIKQTAQRCSASMRRDPQQLHPKLEVKTAQAAFKRDTKRTSHARHTRQHTAHAPYQFAFAGGLAVEAEFGRLEVGDALLLLRNQGAKIGLGRLPSRKLILIFCRLVHWGEENHESEKRSQSLAARESCHSILSSSPLPIRAISPKTRQVTLLLVRLKPPPPTRK